MGMIIEMHYSVFHHMEALFSNRYILPMQVFAVPMLINAEVSQNETEIPKENKNPGHHHSFFWWIEEIALLYRKFEMHNVPGLALFSLPITPVVAMI